MNLILWANICVGVGFFVVLVGVLVSFWLKSRPKTAGSRGDLVHKALVGTGPDSSESSHVHHSENGCVFLANGTTDIVTEVYSEASLKAFNLDKADKEFKGRHFLKARQAALGEEVRRKIASRSFATPLKEQDYEEKSQQRFVLSEKDQVFAEDLKQVYATEEDSNVNGSARSADLSLLVITTKVGVPVPQSSVMSWGHCYSQKELKDATNSFSEANVLGQGIHGTVYHGQLPDGTHIVLKSLSNKRGQAQKDFEVEVEAIGRVRHKNLVRLIGYCIDGSQRMLVYEYIDNGNLDQWLHGSLGSLSPLSWSVRMNIVLDTAKGLAYLHEALEPKVVHRDVKSSNILLDNQWNAKVSDFGFAKLLGAENSHVTTRVMGTFGYVAPEYALTGMLTEKSDVFSYGVLVMELITGRVPFDHDRPAREENLVDWLKFMVGNRRSEEVVDPKMMERPSARSLKRALLVALRCVDPDASKRPNMGHVVHMLETANDHLFCKEPNVMEADHQRKNQLPTILQKHKFFSRPAFMLPQKSRFVEKVDQTEAAPYEEGRHNDGHFVGIVDSKTAWKYER